MRSVRVGLVIGQLHAGGSERQLFELARGLKGGPCEPLVYCLSEVTDPYGGRLAAEKIPLRLLPRSHGLELRRVVGLAKGLRSDRIDVVNSFSQHTNLYAYLAIRLGCRGVFIASNRVSDLPESAALRRLNGFVYRRGRWVVANSADGAKFVARHYGVRAERVEVIPNGIDPARFASPHAGEEARRALGIPLDAPLAGLVGRVLAQKRVDLFLEAARRTAERIGQARFLVVGEGELLEAMKSAAARMGLDSRLLFTGATENADALIAALDLLVLTSDFEGLPNVVMEAMAAGRPVVATDVGSCRELVVDGVTGFLVPPGDAEAVFRRMVDTLSLADRGRSLGAAGSEKIRREFTVPAMVRRFESLYLRAAARPAPPLDGAAPLS